ncbi:hypothetical protein D3C80_2009710 [compost metagenome]
MRANADGAGWVKPRHAENNAAFFVPAELNVQRSRFPGYEPHYLSGEATGAGGIEQFFENG